MKIKYIFTILLIIVSFGHANSQYKAISDLKIGDDLPIFNIPKLVGSSRASLNTGSFKDRLLIIDFWSTGCSGCVEALPYMQALQKKFGDQITILPVTYEKETEAVNFLKQNKYTKDFHLPYVVEDTILRAYFKHKFIPHEVWVYKGKVVGITEPDYVDAANIQLVLDGKQPSWPLKYDYYTFNKSVPLFRADSSQLDPGSTLLRYAAICGYREKFSSAMMTLASIIRRDSVNKTIRVFTNNEQILSAYVQAWMHITSFDKLIQPTGGWSPNCVSWEVTDKSKYFFDRIKKIGYFPGWIRQHGICFESVYTDRGQPDSAVYREEIADLDRLLGLHVRWEKRRERVLNVVRSSVSADKVQKLKGGKVYPISTVAYQFNQFSDNPYMFNNSEDNEKTVVLQESTFDNADVLTKELRANGYDLKEEWHDVDKLVFSEVGGGRVIDVEMQREEQLKMDSQKEMKEPEISEMRSFLEINKNQPGIHHTDSGLQYKILKSGDGPKPKPGSKILLQYEGRLVNGKIFDSSYQWGRPVEMIVNQAIKGWFEALQLMPEGSKWTLYIPSGLAYGSHTGHGTFPVNSTLVYDVELLKTYQ